MTNADVIRNWLEGAEYDLATARAMLETGRYLYVAFTCQQAVEKTLKAIHVFEKAEAPPRIHNLHRLAVALSPGGSLEDRRIDLLNRLTLLYSESRYSECSATVARLHDERVSATLLAETEELIAWLRIFLR